MTYLWNCWTSFTSLLERWGVWVAWVLLRFLIGWEFLEAGLEKYGGSNWFSHIQNNFLFPFNLLPVDVNWNLAMWFEIVGGAALILGLFTRFFSVNLLVITIVAIAAVHWPDSWGSLSELWESYSISKKGDGYGNFKLPLIFITMLLPLSFMGGGKLSLDNLLGGWMSKKMG